MNRLIYIMYKLNVYMITRLWFSLLLLLLLLLLFIQVVIYVHVLLMFSCYCYCSYKVLLINRLLLL